VNHFLSGLILLMTLFHSGCLYRTHDIRGELPETKNVVTGDIVFSLNLQSSHHTNTLGVKTHKGKRIEEYKNTYITSTLNTLRDLGYSVKLASSSAEANFTIDVSRQIQLSALPQEYCAGMTFFVIPCWGTRYNQYTYTFTHHDSGQSHTYKIDENMYCHISLLPVFWINFFTPTHEEIYGRALTNFVKSRKVSLQSKVVLENN